MVPRRRKGNGKPARWVREWGCGGQEAYLATVPNNFMWTPYTTIRVHHARSQEGGWMDFSVCKFFRGKWGACCSTGEGVVITRNLADGLGGSLSAVRPTERACKIPRYLPPFPSLGGAPTPLTWNLAVEASTSSRMYIHPHHTSPSSGQGGASAVVSGPRRARNLKCSSAPLVRVLSSAIIAS